MNLANCNESQAKALLKQAKLALLPLGATEPHGDHLPLNTDNLLAERFAKKLDAKLREQGIEVVRLPTLPFSQVWSLAGFAGALDIGPKLLADLLIALASNMAGYGIDTLVVINSHYGNFDAMKAAARTLKKRGITLLNFTWYQSQALIQTLQQSPSAHPSFMHADEIETSMMLSLAPEWVDLDKARAHYPDFPDTFSFEQIPWPEFSDYSVLGDPTLASQRKGDAVIEHSLSATLAALSGYLESRYVNP
ncbi:Putative mycofactocin system creatinine amidohydrolase family protein MftE [Vibrio stylophorae]|uniref:Mycofactocin system creatinine amidohydrolase family protein MftE n=1 Tax=Vibrio stylophorae TaxID=659351 RepID=A0ABM8ZXC3_9VIBR|nr:creatininase family protein [Vibrio stylophorae]CAH0535250.1 Putative mycofactocin system creatinine amidohydrolase family protein MftE [Vibrio stylophorae]